MVPLGCATVAVCRGTGSKRRVRDLEAGPQLQNSLTSRSIGVTEFWHNVKYLMVFFSSTRWLEYFGVCPALSDAPWTVWITENDPDVCSSSGKSMSPLCAPAMKLCCSTVGVRRKCGALLLNCMRICWIHLSLNCLGLRKSCFFSDAEVENWPAQGGLFESCPSFVPHDGPSITTWI